MGFESSRGTRRRRAALALVMAASLLLTACGGPEEASVKPRRLTDKRAFLAASEQWAADIADDKNLTVGSFRESLLLSSPEQVAAALELDAETKPGEIRNQINEAVAKLPHGGRYVLIVSGDKAGALRQQVYYAYRDDQGELGAAQVAAMTIKGGAPSASADLKKADTEAISAAEGGNVVTVKSSDVGQEAALKVLTAEAGGNTTGLRESMERQLAELPKIGHLTIATSKQLGGQMGVFWVYWDGNVWKARRLRPD